MGAAEPKQYHSLLGRTVLEWALDPFLDRPGLRGVRIALAADDSRFQRLGVATRTDVVACRGGDDRAQSVLNALDDLGHAAEPGDLILVHDAARPCLERADVDALLATAHSGPEGALLAIPVADTLKLADAEQRCARTLPRNETWRAATPQMFSYELLRRALVRARQSGTLVSDEAQAVELLGLRPRLVECRSDNLKITRPADLELAAAILAARIPPGRSA
jgi:2-C-methyl-D-erythritol 4-phosphate cytidylyltransferase